jgi:hypothetical protein
VECKLTFFLLLGLQEQSLSLCHTGSEKDPGTGKNSSRIRIPNPGGKKAPDPQHCPQGRYFLYPVPDPEPFPVKMTQRKNRYCFLKKKLLHNKRSGVQ